MNMDDPMVQAILAVEVSQDRTNHKWSPPAPLGCKVATEPTERTLQILAEVQNVLRRECLLDAEDRIRDWADAIDKVGQLAKIYKALRPSADASVTACAIAAEYGPAKRRRGER